MGIAGFLSIWLVMQVIVWGTQALDCDHLNDFTISSPEDVASLNKCTAISGRIIFSASAPSDIQLNGPKSFASLQISSGKSLRSISSSSLQSIDSIRLDGLPNLAALNFSALNTLKTLELENLPALENCSFGLGPRSVVKVYNTSLQTVDWLKWPITTQLNITSNPNLASVSLPWDTIDGPVTINSNPMLEKVEVFSIGNISDNFTLQGNGALRDLAFAKLESVDWNVQLEGAFSNISMPALEKVGGSLKVKSTEDIQGFCDELAKKGLKQRVECTSSTQKENSASEKSTPSQAPESSPSPSGNPDANEDASDMTTGAKAGIIIAAVILGLFLVVGAVFFFRARSRGKVREIVISAPRPISESLSVPASSVSSPKLESAEAVVGTKAANAGGVKLVLNGEDMKEMGGDYGTGQAEARLGRDASLRSVSSAGSEVPLVKQ